MEEHKTIRAVITGVTLVALVLILVLYQDCAARNQALTDCLKLHTPHECREATRL